MGREPLDRELERLANRLETMPASRIHEDVIDRVHATAEQIVALTQGTDRPDTAVLPRVEASALAAQLTGVVRDYWETTTAASHDAAVAQYLIDLRKSLP
ncbi:MAG: hypothetical protein VYA56_06905 [Actinomycetota bacterium]|nr:hypothetical protein [Actinomycetota bacterium]